MQWESAAEKLGEAKLAAREAATVAAKCREALTKAQLEERKAVSAVDTTREKLPGTEPPASLGPAKLAEPRGNWHSPYRRRYWYGWDKANPAGIGAGADARSTPDESSAPEQSTAWKDFMDATAKAAAASLRFRTLGPRRKIRRGSDPLRSPQKRPAFEAAPGPSLSDVRDARDARGTRDASGHRSRR